MRTLNEIVKDTESDKGSEHSYLDVYEQLFTPIRLRPLTLLEIGVGGHGGSMILWLEYFPNAQIIRLDAFCLPPQGFCLGKPRLSLIQCNQLDKDSLNSIFPDNSLDIIIDDGSHIPEHQALTHYFIWDKLKKGGLYCIEDIQHNTGPANSLHYWGSLGAKIFELHKNGRYDDVLVVLQKE